MAENERPTRRVFRQHPLLGTMVEVVLVGGSEAVAHAVSASVVSEVERLEAVFSAYLPDSELQRWKRGEIDGLSAEFCAVMSLAGSWQRRSGGAFNPLSGEVSAVWEDAERAGVVPSTRALEAVAAAIAAPRFEMRDGVPVRTGDCGLLNLHAIAKGFIVDQAAAVAPLPAEVHSILVSAGGDMVHRGSSIMAVGIEHPLRPFDNEPPITSVGLLRAGLATSGGARRGFQINGQWFSHVIDPRTAQPVDEHASISIVAPTAMEADVHATVAGVMATGEALEYIEEIVDVGCCIVERDGRVRHDSTWGERAALVVNEGR
ncbi:MAG: FAD:protein FMN transferase [Ilumatobacter sp.]